MRQVLFIFVATLLTFASAQMTTYTTADGLGSDFVRGVYAAGSTIYVATSGVSGSIGGLSISTDDGANWTNYTTAQGLGDNIVRGVYAAGSTIYAATSGGLSISTDDGANWTNYTTAEGLGSDFLSDVYATGSTIYAATNSNGLSISTDDGANWTNYTTAEGLGSDFVQGVYAAGNTIYTATFGGLSISTDDGANWTNYTTAEGLGNNNVNGVYAAGSTIYAATGGGGLSISTDDGANWTNYTTAQGLGSDLVWDVYAAGSTIYAATSGGLSISTDDGANWTNYTTAEGLGNNNVRVIYAAGSTIYAATDVDGLSVGVPFTPTGSGGSGTGSGGSGINPDPDMQIRAGATTAAASITSGAVVNIGAFNRGELATVDFLIRNPGAQVLELGELSLPSFLSVAGEPLPETLASFGSALLTLSVDTNSAGALEGDFSLASNDPDAFENPFVFTITGNVRETPANLLSVLPGVDLGFISASAGQEDVVLLSFQLAVPAGSVAVTVDRLGFGQSQGGIARANNLRLYIDGGTRGELDPRDVFVASTDDTEDVTFTFPARTFQPELPMWFIVVGDF